MGALTGVAGAGMMAHGVSQVADGNLLVGGMSTAMGGAMMASVMTKAGILKGFTMLTSKMGVLGMVAAGAAITLSKVNDAVNAREADEKANNEGVMARGAQALYTRDNVHEQVGGARPGQAEMDALHDDMSTVAGRDKIKSSQTGFLSNMLTGKQSGYWKGRGSHWAQMDSNARLGLDGENQRVVNKSGEVVGQQDGGAFNASGSDSDRTKRMMVEAHAEAIVRAEQMLATGQVAKESVALLRQIASSTESNDMAHKPTVGE
jgi:hypothetical protein